jgi:hypothetical protein
MAREIAERVLVAANVAPDEGGAAGPCRALFNALGWRPTRLDMIYPVI